MNDYFAIEFILEEQSAVLQALNDITLILESCSCILPASYHDPQSNSLILVWRYEKNKNEQAWDVCHHLPHMLFNEKGWDMVKFYNTYHTAPICFSSEHCFHLLRFGNPHNFTFLGDIPLVLENLSILYEHQHDRKKFTASVKDLMQNTIQMINSFANHEIKKLDFATLYLLYKKIEGMSITTTMQESAKIHLFFLNKTMKLK